MNKWLKNLYRYYSSSFNDHFKSIKNILALKTAEIQAFEKFSLDFELFEWQHVDQDHQDEHVQHNGQQGYDNRLHVGLINGDGIYYNGKSGDEIPIKILFSLL